MTQNNPTPPPRKYKVTVRTTIERCYEVSGNNPRDARNNAADLVEKERDYNNANGICSESSYGSDSFSSNLFFTPEYPFGVINDD